jgi:hypothetical protein
MLGLDVAVGIALLAVQADLLPCLEPGLATPTWMKQGQPGAERLLV